ncbi:MAG: hypothetical protein VKK42_20425 [Lyngbya sp.]|nr:hypothetical protein [Lyngbya sp.]
MGLIPHRLHGDQNCLGARIPMQFSLLTPDSVLLTPSSINILPHKIAEELKSSSFLSLVIGARLKTGEIVAYYTDIIAQEKGYFSL